MNRDQKAAVIDEIAADISESQAIFAVDYRGISVAQADQLRATLRQADAVFRVVKNSLTERAAQKAGADELVPLLSGPTALTFVRGDAAAAAKAVADFTRATQLMAFKGGLMDGATLSSSDVSAISRLPSRDVLYGQLVGLIANPLSGLARTLNALIGGLAVGLGGVLAKKESGELPAGEPPAVEAAAPSVDAAEEEVESAGAESTSAAAAEEPADSAGVESPQRPAAEGPGDSADSGGAAGADDAAASAESALAGPAAAEEPAAEAPAAETPAAQESPAETPTAEEPAAEESLAAEVAAEDPVEEGEPDKDTGDALDTTTTEPEAEAAPAAEAEDETEGAAPEAPSGDEETEDQ
jgi:large subunit ribosomal protein L10